MINIAICDDDKNDLKVIVDMVKEVLNATKVDYKIYDYNSPKKMLQEKKYIDIGILDIAMNELNGIDLGRKIKVQYPKVKLIYITNFKEFCIRAINEAHAYAYLSKPINKEKLTKQLIEIVKDKKKNIDSTEKVFYNLKDSSGKEIMVKKINIEDILYFEYIKSKRRVSIVLKDNYFEASYVMDNLIKELEIYNFAINCRGCLVNLEHVSKIKGYNVYLDNGKELPLSQKRVADFKDKLNEFLHSNL